MTAVAETATLVHGYTMADVDRAAAKAAASNSSRSPLPWEDRYEAAWMGIVEALYSATAHVDFPALVLVGLKAVSDESHAYRQAHGMAGASKRDGVPSVSFSKYWSTRGSDRDFTDDIAERLAIPAVLSLLTADEYQAIAALAAHGTQERAARALGMHPLKLHARVKSARHRIIQAWLAPETPRDTSIRSRDSDTCRYGHSRAEHSFVRPNDGGIRCRICERNRDRRRAARSS